ncbi:hypothetical protein P153DRAFT_429743 [Dothidotthia symphoricarpi CBS 119687]|uniref:Rhodopsin domain-containing protein n=1 Tax=Dothidotthia symphoricarpi CBS 119687 TaxID=1392245 RepID=A0A6A6AIR1_9PLEO|nr:uncharacterized protein P153DRAFT_429743 [Dothidotthia symphoricarpi CBS 119687]KAF2131446.1 hypothetical protein P153DRAFT_429743 [Dothidotthia symphoricarpi CBS 119687]
MTSAQGALVGVMPPPAGVTSDFSGSRTDLQNRTIMVNSVMIVLSTLFLGLRLHTRVSICHTIGLDDWLIVLSWLGCVAWMTVCLYDFQYGYGQHLWNVTAEQMAGYLKTLFAVITVYVWVPALTKLSLLALYRRLDPNPKIRACVYALSFLVVGYTLAITIVAAGPCNPYAQPGAQQCLVKLNLFMSVINIVTDLLILLLPVRMLHQLQLPNKQKILLGLIFALGSGVMIVSIVRIIFVYALIAEPDATYHQARAALFSAVEVNGGVICACLALLKPFFQKHLPWLLSLSSRSRSRSGSRKLGIFGGSSGVKSYELHSAGVASDKEDETQKTPGQIAVTTTYDISVPEPRKTRGDGDSAEELFWPESQTWRNAC